ncbi:MAG: hypothetical protein ACOYNY_38015 [Caldilineaceae bacterium]
MADEQLKKKVYNALKKNYFGGPDDAVDVSDGPADSIHVVVVSRKFDGKRLKEKNQLIWNQFMEHLADDEWGKITLSVAASPEEIKAS